MAVTVIQPPCLQMASAPGASDVAKRPCTSWPFLFYRKNKWLVWMDALLEAMLGPAHFLKSWLNYKTLHDVHQDLR
jgi:hypothetical protein